MPLVVDALSEKSYMHSESTGQLGAVAFTDQSQPVLPEARPPITHQRRLVHL